MKYSKFGVSSLTTIFAALISLRAGDSPLTAVEWLNVIVMVLGAISVLGAGNTPTGVWKYMKTYIAAATAGGVYLLSVLTTGSFTDLSSEQWLQFILTVLNTAGVYIAPGPKIVEATIGRHAKPE